MKWAPLAAGCCTVLVAGWSAFAAAATMGGAGSAGRAGSAAADADTTIYVDAQTGFTFSQYLAKYSLNSKGMYIRIAVPSSVPASTDFDVVVQIVAPVDVGWAGLAWGGDMTKNPLAVAWGYASGGVISSRWANGHYLPQPYTGSTYEVLPAGTHSNGTHWQITAKCSGCTAYGSGSGSSLSRLSAHGSNRLAFAYAATKPTSPASNLSSFGEHSVIGYWSHDFSAGENAAFASLVAKNLKSSR
ncbi:Cellobiose dehydrogenase, cytochrome [Niveomyces insectorum RCEF 264]|uniref:Cellobiose dehydrogenase, cytochrome n=1 Tax=Niveomyces insectorum RCEF 264 TaxID=1081102 RepID=A0A167WF52_9HYPO|nr:Cellobiose dehydrogenase, cytochrome [Niveomyces insectorum RCEF 264]